MTAAARRPAKAPERRTVTVELPHPFDGWTCTAVASFKARYTADLASGDIVRIVAALDKIVMQHNFPDVDDPTRLAESMADVDMEALGAVVDAVFDAIGKLPPR